MIEIKESLDSKEMNTFYNNLGLTFVENAIIKPADIVTDDDKVLKWYHSGTDTINCDKVITSNSHFIFDDCVCDYAICEEPIASDDFYILDNMIIGTDADILFVKKFMFTHPINSMVRYGSFNLFSNNTVLRCKLANISDMRHLNNLSFTYIRSCDNKIRIKYALKEYDALCEYLENNGYTFFNGVFYENEYYNTLPRCAICGEIITSSSSSNSLSNNCGEIITSSSSSNNLCNNCSSYYTIQDYSFKPEPKFFGSPKNNRFFGLELEYEVPDNCIGRNDIIRKLVPMREFYAKYDGSLDYGIEFVSHPMSKGHVNSMIHNFIGKIENDVKCLSTCGMHVHVSLDSLGKALSEQELTSAKIIMFLQHHKDNIVGLSGRDDIEDLDRWARIECDNPITPLDSIVELSSKLRSHKNDCRYRALNLQNQHTIEFRFFASTLNADTIKERIELLDNIIEYCMHESLETCYSQSWEHFENKTEKGYK